MAQLLASSASVEGIQNLINNFWVSVKYTVDPETLEIGHPELARTIAVQRDYRVVLRGGRYRFEYTAKKG